jgi:hypothetical protein
VKIRLLLAIAGLAISFALPTFAQQKETVDPKIIEQLNAISKKVDEAVNNNDAAAYAARFTRRTPFLWRPQDRFTVRRLSRNSIQSGSRERIPASKTRILLVL